MASSRMHPLGNLVNEEITNESCRFKVLCSRLGDSIRFPAFSTGEHFWHIHCCPVKDVKGGIGNLTLDLHYGGKWEDVKVNADFGVLKKDEPLSSVKWITNTHTFPMSGAWFKLENVVKGEGLKMYLNDDYFTFLCNIRILSTNNLGGITILSSLTGISTSPAEVQSLQNKHIVSKSLTDSGKGIRKDMACGLVQSKIMCSYITRNANMWLCVPVFIVGDHCWLIWFHYNKKKLELYLTVVSETKDLKAGIEFSVRTKNDATSLAKWSTTHTFTKCGESINMDRFLEGDELKQYLRGDYFIVTCNLTILSETIVSDYDVTIISSTGKPMAHSTNGPSPNLRDDLSKLLQNKERSDVTFEVNGEMFHAHKFLLAARSSVFNEKLFGRTDENKMEKIKINDMELMVFKAMLHFIYTDMLPNLNECSTGGNESNNQIPLIQMLQYLLSAADCYALESLKLICEDKLSNSINIDTVATTLVLAEKHNSPNLKALCIEFVILPEHFSKVALTDGYADLLMSCPNILNELRENLKNIST